MLKMTVLILERNFHCSHFLSLLNTGNIFFMSLLLFLSCFSGHSGPLFWSSYSQLSKGVEEPQNWTRNVQKRDSKSKRDTKNSILVSISGNTAKKFSDSLFSSENYFGLYFKKTRPEIYYFKFQNQELGCLCLQQPKLMSFCEKLTLSNNKIQKFFVLVFEISSCLTFKFLEIDFILASISEFWDLFQKKVCC